MIAPHNLRFAVIQPGARMHYAVPALLAQAGMLQRLYTDICADLGLLPWIDKVVPRGLRPKEIERLLGRRLPLEIDRNKVLQCSASTLLARFTGKRDIDQRVIRLVRSDRFGGADAIYTLLINSDLELVREAKAAGLRIVHETMISPDVGIVLRDERNRFEGIEEQDPQDEMENGRYRDAEKYQVSDLIIVPSDFVRAAVLKLGAPAERVVTLPYGVDASWLSMEPNPIRGRILFVGSVGLRKGNHHLAAATRVLQKRGVDCEVRVIGPIPAQTRSRSIFDGPLYLDQVPRSRVREEFLSADVFVLPSLVEGSATVIYEALACGIPVITTTNSGSVVRDGIEGFVVPVGDSAALADRMQQLVEDRDLRSFFSQNARARAREFTWEKYGERLLAAIARLQEQPQ